jgi:hypothetical protein
VALQPALDRLIRVGAAAPEFVFVLYLHREQGGMFVGLPAALWECAPFPDDLALSVFLIHFPVALSALRPRRLAGRKECPQTCDANQAKEKQVNV